MRLKKRSTKFLRLYISLSYSRGLRALERGGITALPPESSINCTKSLLSYPLSAKTKHFANVRTCIHNQRMPDGRGILLPCKAKKRRQYFVYCKIFQRARPAKDPLRRCRMVVNTGSKTIYKPWGQSNIIQIAS